MRCDSIQLKWMFTTDFVLSSHIICNRSVCLCVQVMVTNVTSLLKTVKAVEDEASRGTRALEATIECIKQELAVRQKTLHFLWFCFLDQQSTRYTHSLTVLSLLSCSSLKKPQRNQPLLKSSYAWPRASPRQQPKLSLLETPPDRRMSSPLLTSAVRS